MKIVTLSSKNQITIPKEAVDRLELLPRRKLFMTYQQDKIILQPLRKSIVDQTAGSLTRYVAKNKLGKSWKTILSETKKKTARKLAQSL